MYTETEKPKNDMYVMGKPKYDDIYEFADVGDRLVAIIADNILTGIIAGVVAGVSGRGEAGVVTFFLVQLAYQWYFLMHREGQTPGKSMMHLRVIKADGSALTNTDVVLRVIGYQINSILFGIGWFWALFDKHHQGWHDMLAKTYVVKD